MDKPTCKVHGMIQRGAMCGMVTVGLKYCDYSGECEHKVAAVPVVPVAAPKLGEQEGARDE